MKDHLGSPRVVVNEATGAVVQRMDFDAWGNILVDTNPGWQPFGFAGGLFDHATKLTRFGARDYDAAAGRWTAKDALRFASGKNPFEYARGEPTRWVDRTGLSPMVCPGLAGCGDPGDGGAPPGGAPEPPCSKPPPAGPLECSDPCDTSKGQQECYACCDFLGADPKLCKSNCCGAYR